MNKWFMLLLCAGLMCSAPADAQRKKKMKKVTSDRIQKLKLVKSALILDSIPRE